MPFAARARETRKPAEAPGLDERLLEQRRRLTYLMLFRVAVVTLLLGATLGSELGVPSEQSPTLRVNALFALIGTTYGLTIVFALWLKRARRFGPLAATQLAADLLLTSTLVHLTGGVESSFAFMYLLVIVSSIFVLPRGALAAAMAASGLYGLELTFRMLGLLTPLDQATTLQPTRELLRAVGVNVVAFLATGALSTRLAVELRRAGERIATQGARLRDLATLHEDVIRCLASGLVTLSRDRVVLTINAAAAEILELDPARVVGRRVDEFMPSMVTLLESVPRDSPLRRSEVVHQAVTGRRILGVSLSPLVDHEDRVIGRIVTFQDLTELRRMEEAVSRAERLAAVGRLAAGVAHEIRNPLAAISGSIELLAHEQEGEGGTRAELMAIVLREVSRLNGLITDLLDFARPRRPEPQPLDLGATLAELLRVFEHDRALGGHPVHLQASPVTAEADPAQLRQVVWNLLRNAAEASPEAGAIEVEVGEHESDGQRWASLVIRDHGSGISPEHQGRVFEPFFSTKQGGTGLGLATVHRIIEEHRGRVELEAAEGGGTRVRVRLPLA